MDQYIKKKLATNWFKTLQEVLCREIEEKEGKKTKFKITNWNRSKSNDCLLYTSPSPRDLP